MNRNSFHRFVFALFAAVSATALSATPVAAQTLRLTDSSATTLRDGSYANTNHAGETTVATRVGSSSYNRRVQLKFDTHNPIAQGTPIASATLTLTVAAGSNTENRTLTLYRGAYAYDETRATWNVRNTSVAWPEAGGDDREAVARQTVTHVAGSKVTFDVTAVIQKIVNGTYGSSRWARFLISDGGAASKTSYKAYHSDEAADASVRPVLTITTGTSTSTTTTQVTAPTTTTTTTSPTGTPVKLRVMEWNIHHGVGTDGVYNIDRLATWMAKMYPDVILLNEVEKYTGWGYEDQPARFKAMLESKTGRKWYAHFSQEFGNWSSNGKGHLILSKYPFDSTSHTTITQSSGLNGAGAASQAEITVNGRRINFILSHLDPYSKDMRLIQARDVIRWASGFAENRILSGDMNAWPDQTSILELNKTYNDAWTVAVNKGTATGISGISPFGATKKGRIDYIFYSKNAPNLVVLDSKTPDTRSSSGVMPSDHRPVVTTFEVR